MMSIAALPLLLMLLVGGNAAPHGNSHPMSEKRAALVLDRLLIALKNALYETPVKNEIEEEVEEPHAVPLRYEPLMETNGMTGLQRRGQASNNKGRVLRCYFNAITCF